MLLIIGTSILGGISANRVANVCTGHSEGTFVQNTQNCSTYYHCFSGNPILTQCPVGQRFNNPIRKCDRADRVDCFECPADVPFLDIPLSNECSQFIRCHNGVSEQLTCSVGLAFDPAYRMCNIEDDVLCHFEVTCPRYDDHLIFFRDRDTCDK